MKALESEEQLIVYVDIKSPYAFVAIRPTLELEASLGIRFDWRPLTLDIPSYLGSAKKVDGKVVESTRSEVQWRFLKYGYRDARRYAERQGYILKGTEKIWDSSIANIGILWVVRNNRDLLKNYFEVVYPPFWRRELDIEDFQVVENCLELAGVDSKGFRDFCQHEGRKIHDNLQAQLHPLGIFGVPTYVVRGKILFGREHLPLVRWLLTGSRGQAPDIAYEISDSV
ncbi:DsbA family protein [bacterium]|nr:DsbA family protein [bacterium]